MKEENKQNDKNSAKRKPVDPAGASHFPSDIKRLIDEAEDTRRHLMKQYETRGFTAYSLGMFFVIAGACGFGWFFFYKFDFLQAVLCLLLGFIPFYLLQQYKMKPLLDYKRQHKSVFMPKLAQALGGLQYRPKSGISAKILLPAKILPSFEQYKAEDCLSGTYKETKIIISEAHMSHRKHKNGYVFDGIFVLLELPAPRLEGHTIITADRHAASRWKQKRWQGLAQITIPNQKMAGFFEVFSNNATEAGILAGEKILERLAELSAEFDNAPLSVSFYRDKYIFMMIPYDVDLFEPSDLYMPVATTAQAQRCKNEIEKILSIIELLNMYKHENPESKDPHE